jgi:hypothetical protein
MPPVFWISDLGKLTIALPDVLNISCCNTLTEITNSYHIELSYSHINRKYVTNIYKVRWHTAPSFAGISQELLCMRDLDGHWTRLQVKSFGSTIAWTIMGDVPAKQICLRSCREFTASLYLVSDWSWKVFSEGMASIFNDVNNNLKRQAIYV